MLRLEVLMILMIASSFPLTQIQVALADQQEDRVGNLVSAGVEYLRTTLSKQDPTSIPDSASLQASVAATIGLFPTNQTNSLNMTNVRYSGISKVKTEVIKTDSEQLTAQLRLTFPEIKLAGDYQINGEWADKKFKGEGGFELNVFNVTWNVGNLQLLETEQKAFKITSLGLSVYTGDISFVTNGLSVENMTVAEFEKHVSRSIQSRMKSSMAPSSRGYERAFMNTWNKRIGNRTLEEFTQWLKEKPSFEPGA